MDERIREAFDVLRAPERLKRKTKAALRKKTFDYGRNVYRLRLYRRRLAGAALMLALLLGGGGLWFLPATSIGVDINPSIELKVNALDRVIALRPGGVPAGHPAGGQRPGGENEIPFFIRNQLLIK